MSRLLMALLLVLSSATAFAVTDPDDAEGTADHPAIPRFPGFYIAEGRQAEFDTFVFETAREKTPGTDEGQPRATREGRFWSFRYHLKEGATRPSPVAVVRNFENAAKKAGGRVLFTQTGQQWYREGGVFVMPAGKTERWVRLSVSSDSEYELQIVEVAAMEQKLEMSADQMSAELDKIGFVALRGILFDTGKAEIKPESRPLLDEIVALLKAKTSLKVSVEGHTDNVGDRKANAALSKRRAEAVLAALVAGGIDAKRLKADGRGDSMPVADNRLESGRALNRRVELVKF